MATKGKIAAMILVGIALMTFLIVIFIQAGAFPPAKISIDKSPALINESVPSGGGNKEAVEIIELPKASGNVNDAADAFLQESVGEELNLSSEASVAEAVFSSQDLSDLANTYDENEF